MVELSDSQSANLIAVVSILGVLIGLGVSIEAGNQSGAIHGPLGLAANENHAYFQAGSSLYVTDHAGRLQESIPLAELGIQGNVVDMETVGEEVFMVEGDSGRVSRCRLAARECEAVAEVDIAPSFGTALDIAVDVERARLYVASAAGHRVDAYDLAGEPLFEIKPEKGFLFPNEIVLLDGGGIAVADTNNHRIVAVTAAERGDTLWEFSARTDLASRGRVWPASITADAAGNWWLINLNNGMKEGEVFVFSSEGQAKRRVELPAGADPLNLAAIEDRMLVADFDGFRLFTVGPGGQSVAPFGDAAARRVFEDLQATKSYWNLIRQAAFVLILIFAAFGAFAVFLDKRATRTAAEPGRRVGKVQHPEAIAQARNVLPPAGRDGIVWITMDPKQKRLIKVVFAVVLALLALQLIVVAPFFADSRILLMMLPMFLLPVFGFLFLRKMTGARIGIGASVLHLVDVQAKRAEGPVHEALYSDYALLLKGVMVNFRMFPKEALERAVMPFLTEARKVGQLELTWHVVKANRRLMMLGLGALVLMLASLGALKLMA